MRGRAPRVIAAMTASALLCAADPSVAAPRPPGLRPANLSSEEAGLWQVSDKAEAKVKASGELDEDPQLNAYVREVECKIAPEYCGELRIYILDRPFFQAQMAPNGYAEVWSGLLLRARNEAELAFVLGHETSHFAENHSLASHRALKARANEALVFSMILMAGAAYATYSAGGTQTTSSNGSLVNIVYLAEIAAFFRFSREQEAEADRLGLQRLIRAGYDPAAAPSAWRGLIEEQARSEFEKVRKLEGAPNLFASHPVTRERMDQVATLAKDQLGRGELGRERYRAAIRPHLGSWLRDDLRRRDYGETLYLIERLAADGEDAGVLNYYRGECLRLRRGEGDAARAVSAYEAATSAVDAPPETWRELGNLLMAQHQSDKALSAYKAYLERAPSAQDRWLIESSVSKLSATLGGT